MSTYKDKHEIIKYVLRENSTREKPLSQKEIREKVELLGYTFCDNTWSQLMRDLREPVLKTESTDRFKKEALDGKNEFDTFVFYEIDDEEKIYSTRTSKSRYWSESIFTNAELAYLLDSVLYSSILTKKETDDFIEKIEHIGGKALKQQSKYTRNMRDKIYRGHAKQKEEIDDSYLYTGDASDIPKTVLDKVQLIREAINSEPPRKISFYLNVYSKGESEKNLSNPSGIGFKHYKEKRYIVTPYDVILKNDKYFLVGSDHIENSDIPFKYYRIDLMTEVNITKKKTSNKRDDNITISDALYDVVTKQPFIYSGKVVPVEVEVEKDHFTNFVDTFGTGITITRENEKHYRVKFYVNEKSLMFYAMQNCSWMKILTDTYKKKFEEYLLEAISNNYPDVIEKIKKDK